MTKIKKDRLQRCAWIAEFIHDWYISARKAVRLTENFQETPTYNFSNFEKNLDDMADELELDVSGLGMPQKCIKISEFCNSEVSSWPQRVSASN